MHKYFDFGISMSESRVRRRIPSIYKHHDNVFRKDSDIHVIYLVYDKLPKDADGQGTVTGSSSRCPAMTLARTGSRQPKSSSYIQVQVAAGSHGPVMDRLKPSLRCRPGGAH